MVPRVMPSSTSTMPSYQLKHFNHLQGFQIPHQHTHRLHHSFKNTRTIKPLSVGRRASSSSKRVHDPIKTQMATEWVIWLIRFSNGPNAHIQGSSCHVIIICDSLVIQAAISSTFFCPYHHSCLTFVINVVINNNHRQPYSLRCHTK